MVTVVFWADFAPKVADTTAVPPFSAMVVLSSASITVGVASSLVIVPVPTEVPTAALCGLLSFNFTVSSGSFKSSAVTVTSTVWLVLPAANVKVFWVKVG